MNKTVLALILTVSILVGCSKKPSQNNDRNAQAFPYPETVADIKADPTYKLSYTGEKTKVQYYLKEISNEELDKYSDDDPVHDTVLSGDEQSWIFIPVKEEQIVEYSMEHLSDVTAIAMKVTYGDNPIQPQQEKTE